MAEDTLPSERNILVMGGLTGLSTLMLASLLTFGSCDPLWKKCSVPVTVSILAFAIGLPPMAISILFAYAWLESKKKVASKLGNILRGIGYLGLSVGILATFWQLSIYAGVLFLVFSIFSFFCFVMYRTQIKRANSPPKETSEHNPSETHVQ